MQLTLKDQNRIDCYFVRVRRVYSTSRMLREATFLDAKERFFSFLKLKNLSLAPTQKSFYGYYARRLSAAVAANGDVLRIRCQIKLAAVFSSAVVCQGSDELIA